MKSTLNLLDETGLLTVWEIIKLYLRELITTLGGTFENHIHTKNDISDLKNIDNPDKNDGGLMSLDLLTRLNSISLEGIRGIVVNNTSLTPDELSVVGITIPVNVSDLPNDAGYLTADDVQGAITASLNTDLTVASEGNGNAVTSISKSESSIIVHKDTTFLTEHQDISGKANVTDVYTKTEADETFLPIGNYLTQHQDISGKANVGDSYTKQESDNKYQPVGNYLTLHQDISGKADKSAAIGSLSLSINPTNFLITLSGTKVDGTSFTVQDVIDLPLESVVVSGSYNNTTKKVVLTLLNGSTIDFSVADLVAGLQSTIDNNHKLSADLVDDTNTTHKFVTASEKTTWNSKYDKPSTGIPSTDLANDVLTSLGKADTALLLHQDISGKADKVSNATNGNFAGLDTNGNLTDSGKKASDFATSGHTHTFLSITDKVVHGNEFNFVDTNLSSIFLNYRRSNDTFATTPTSLFYLCNGEGPVNGLVLCAELVAKGYKIPHGSASQFLKADGTIDERTYIHTGVDEQTKSGNIKAAKFITNGGTSALLVTGTGTLLNISTLAPYEAFLQWGGRNLADNYSPIDAALAGELSANRFAFFPYNNVDIEYSRDGGLTWLDYGLSGGYKGIVFAKRAAIDLVIGKATEEEPATTDYLLRITMRLLNSGLYTILNKFIVYCATYGSAGCYCTILGRTKSDVNNNIDTWTTFNNLVTIGGWSGYNVINYPEGICFGANSNNIAELRFIFGARERGSSSSGATIYPGLKIYWIGGYGGVGWSIPSYMAENGHLYSWDALLAMVVPANIYPRNTLSLNLGDPSRYWWNIYSNKFIKNGGTSSQFLKADGSVDSTTYYSKPSNGIPSSDLESTIQSLLTAAGTALLPSDITTLTNKVTALEDLVATDSDAVIDKFNEIVTFLNGINATDTLSGLLADIASQINAKYTKPSGGIPSSDLDSSVLASLALANSALQSHQSLKTVNNQSLVGSGNITIQENVKSDWEASPGTDGEILNKPNIPTKVSDLNNTTYNETKDFIYRLTADGVKTFDGNKGSISSMKGNTLAWNQLLPFINVENYTTRTRINITDGISSYDSSAGNYWSWCPFISTYQINYSTKNHVYYIACYVVTNTTEYGHFSIGEAANKTFTSHFQFNGETGYKSYICTNNTEHKLFGFTLQSYPYIMTSADSLSIKDVMAIDLTLIYGAGNEPSTPEEFEADYLRWFGKPLSYEDYDAGSLRNVQMQGLKATGFNQWDEEWEQGAISVASWNYISDQNRIRPKNFISVLPNTSYYIYVASKPTGQVYVIFYYDDDMTKKLSYKSLTSRRTFTTPTNCRFIKFSFETTTQYGGTYNNDICINISDTQKNGTYEPYEEHNVSVPVTTLTGKVNGQGESVVIFPDGMKGVGDIKDEIKVENGVTKAIKRIGRVDLGTLTWNRSSTAVENKKRFLGESISNSKLAEYNLSNLVVSKYSKINATYAANKDGFAPDNKRLIAFIDAYSSYTNEQFKSAMSGVYLDYELAEPVEYIIDDFNLPVNYKISKYGTEEVISATSTISVAPTFDLTYGIDPIQTLEELPDEMDSKYHMTAGDNVIINNNEISVPTFPVNKVVPIYEKTYENYICGSNAYDLYLYFGDVITTSTNWYDIWEIYYTVKITTAVDACQGEYDVRICFTGPSVIYSIYNRYASSSAYPIYYHYFLYHNSISQYTNRVEHPFKIGVRVLSAYLPTSVARTYNIKVWELRNCTFNFPENIETHTNLYNSSYYTLLTLNATSLGLQESGDNTDVYTMRLTYAYLKAGTNGIKMYSLVMQDGDGNWLSFTTGTGGILVTKQKNPIGFRLGSRVYYISRNSDLAAGSTLSSSTVHAYTALLDWRYTLNINTTVYDLPGNLMPYLPVYIVGHMGSDGLFYLEDMWWTLHEPTYNDGKIYIRVSEAVYPDYVDARCYRADLVSDGYAYWFKDGQFLRYYGSESIPQVNETTNEFTYRETPNLATSNNAEITGIKGNTMAWHLMLDMSAISAVGNQTITVSGNTYTSTHINNILWRQVYYSVPTISGHIYYFSAKYKLISDSTNNGRFYLGYFGGSNTLWLSNDITGETLRSGYNHSFIKKPGSNNPLVYVGLYGTSGSTILAADTVIISDVMLIDLTRMYGAGNEPIGTLLFESDYFRWFGKPLNYEPYDAGSLRNVLFTSIKSVGFNLWDEEYELGGINISGEKISGSDRIRSKNTIQVLPLTTYYFKNGTSANNGDIFYYDENNINIGHKFGASNKEFTTPKNTKYILLGFTDGYGTTYNNDICINISDLAKNGTYEAYQSSTASIPITTITGKLNGTGSSVIIFPDGMKSVNDIRDEIYVENGVTKAIKRIGRVDLGTLDYITITDLSSFEGFANSSNIGGAKAGFIGVCGKYTFKGAYWNVLNDKECGYIYNNRICIKDSSFTLDSTGANQLKTSLNGVYLDYELSEPEEYVVDNFSLPVSYTAYKTGTEELTSTGLAPILDITYGFDNEASFNVLENRVNSLENTLNSDVIEGITFNGNAVSVSNKVAAITSNLDKVPLVSGTAAASVTIEPYKMYNFGTLSIPMTIVFDTSKEVSGYCAEYCFRFVADSGCSITLPSGVKKTAGSMPVYVTGRSYEFDIVDNLCVIGEFY